MYLSFFRVKAAGNEAQVVFDFPGHGADGSASEKNIIANSVLLSCSDPGTAFCSGSVMKEKKSLELLEILSGRVVVNLSSTSTTLEQTTLSGTGGSGMNR